MTTKKLLASIEDVLSFKPIIDHYRHTILNRREVAKEILKEFDEQMTKQELQNFLDAILPTDQELENAKEEVKKGDDIYNAWLVNGFCVCVRQIKKKAEIYLEKYV